MQRGTPMDGSADVPADAYEVLAALLERRDQFLLFLRRRAKSDEADDLLQLAYMRATNKIHSLRDRSLADAWFYRILRRVVADHVNEAARRSQLTEGGDAPPPLSPVATRVACGCSLQLMQTLPPQYAEVLRRIDLLEETVEEAATELSTTTGNVLVRLHRARKALRDRLRRRCGTTSSRDCLDCACDQPPDASSGITLRRD
jgi:RNA polymerase sigma factor (sigma-70 family)